MEHDSLTNTVNVDAPTDGLQLSRRTVLRAGGGGLAAALTFAGLRAATAAEVATPAGSPAPTGPVTVAAHWLTNPRGFTWDSNGVLYVALAGTGGAEIVDLENIGGPGQTGNSAIIAKIDKGTPVPVASNLPSTLITHQRTIGLAALAILGDKLYLLEDANSMGFRPTGDNPDGVYRVETDGTVTLVADTGTWIGANPAKFKPADFNPRGEVFGMVADKESLWVVESNIGQVLRITPDGKITRVADLSTGHPIPTAPALSPNGGIYVGYLTAVPYFTGAAKVVEIMPDGKITDVWTGLTMITAVAFDADGTLYAAEMATNNGTTPPYVAPDTGKVVRRTGQDSSEDVATHINYPVAMAVGPDNALYVGAPAMGSTDADGYILRIDVSAAGPTDVRSVASTVGGKGLGIPTKGDFGNATPADNASTATATSEPSPTASTGASSKTVELEAGDFFFKPNAVSIAANTAVTFAIKNGSPLPHNFSIDELKVSIYMQPGETGKVTINAAAGTYEYYCNLPGHKEAGMFGKLTVK
ncbi:MAG: ScyD/ScyE family protein [Thermomicrobiales bacterium]